MTEPHEVCLKDSNKIIGYACPSCHLFCSPLIYACKWDDALKAAYDHAMSCCADRICKDCGVNMGAPKKTYWLLCVDCREKKDATKESGLFRAAKKIHLSEYRLDFLYYADEFYDNVELLFDRYDEDERPRYAWACEPIDFSLDAVEIVNAGLEHGDHHEDAFDEVSDQGLKRLQGYLDLWCKKEAVRSWTPNFELAVMLTKEKDGQWLTS